MPEDGATSTGPPSTGVSPSILPDASTAPGRGRAWANVGAMRLRRVVDEADVPALPSHTATMVIVGRPYRLKERMGNGGEAPERHAAPVAASDPSRPPPVRRAAGGGGRRDKRAAGVIRTSSLVTRLAKGRHGYRHDAQAGADRPVWPNAKIRPWR